MRAHNDFVEGFRPDLIPTAAMLFRHDRSVPQLHQQFDGSHCRIFRLDFVDTTWAMRVPIHNRFSSRDLVIQSLDQERLILEKLGALNKSWIPRLIGHSLTFDNTIRYPFLVLEWAHGKPIHWTNDTPTRKVRNKVLAQVAKMQACLLQNTRLSGIPASEHFRRIVSNKFARVRRGELDGLSEQDIEDQMNLLPSMIIPELEHAGSALDHGDLKFANIIADEDWNITGIIDWGFATMAPVHLAARLPCFLQSYDITVQPSAALLEDRKVYLAALDSGSEADKWMVLMQSMPDVDFRHAYLESVVNKGMHKMMVAHKWTMPWKSRP